MAKKEAKPEVPKVEMPANESPIETAVVEQEVKEEPVQEAVVEEAPVEAKPKRAPKPEVPEVAPAKTPVKNVKIVLVADIDSYINGERYQYPAKKLVEVPSDVAQILVFSGKAYRM